jgi:mono/diheme cytochrome c family protein
MREFCAMNSANGFVSRMSNWKRAFFVLSTCTFVLAAWLFWPASPIAVSEKAAEKAADKATEKATDSKQLVEKGRYLAKLGNCQACHSVAGYVPFAGGTPIETPFGVVYGSNLTPSKQGIGAWSEVDFWRALHHGQAPSGRWLIPAFPFTNTTHINRDDSDALFAFLKSLPPDETPNRPQELRWPYNTQTALKAWRVLYFKAGDVTASPSQTANSQANTEQTRGKYLVNALAHCSACHAPRDRWGGSSDALSLMGGEMPSGWYAPSLHAPAEAGLQGWNLQDAMVLLKSGRHAQHLVSGPMAEVVAQSLSGWKEDDVRAVATYLTALPIHKVSPDASAASSGNMKLGAKLYEKHCAACHGEKGEGYALANGLVAYPALAGNRAVTMNSTANLVQVVLHGGFSLATPEIPRPFGMPPFMQEFDDASTAAVLSYIRGSWGNPARPVTELDVLMHRSKTQR